MTDRQPTAEGSQQARSVGELTAAAPPRRAPLRDVMVYASGDGVNSLVMNSIAGFSMLYYTEALNLDYKQAGIAMGVAMFWDAITDPVMGHVTDNTRSRFGRRHPYMLLGGLMTVACFYFIWAVPTTFREPALLFWYLVAINLLLRTGITIFAVAHSALGFEICTDYTQRATLQSVRMGVNMAFNLAGPAMAWTLFFKDRPGVESTTVPSNFVHMGTAFSVAALVLVMFVVFATRKYLVDSRDNEEIVGNSPRAFLRSFRDILLDRYPMAVFAFMAVVAIGISLVASLQMYVYVHFMEFTSEQRSIAHGATMVACGLGALLSPLLVRRYDKKPAVFRAVLVSVTANVLLLLVFVGGLVSPGAGWRLPEGLALVGGGVVPVALLLFMLFQGLYWGSNGVLTPIANSMMADVSEICKCRTGVLKDGGYSAMLTFITKTAMSIGLLLCGFILDWVGFDAERDVQSAAAIQRLGATTFILGAAVAAAALVPLVFYPVTRAYMARIKAALAGGSPGLDARGPHGDDTP